MSMDNLLGTQSIIITLDVTELLFEKLQHIIQAGLSMVEINTVDTALLKKISQTFPQLSIGAGAIITTQQLEDCYQTKTRFVTSPGFFPPLQQTASIYSMNYLPSIATISEAMEAFALGCHYVRVLPADFELCTMLNKYLPLLHLFPAEIEPNDINRYLDVPAVDAVSIINPDIRSIANMVHYNGSIKIASPT